MTQSGMRDSCHVARKQTLPIPIRSDAIENMRRLYKYQTTKDLQIMVGSLDVFFFFKYVYWRMCIGYFKRFQ